MANNWPGVVDRILGAALTHFGEPVTFIPAANPASFVLLEGVFNEVWREVAPDGAIVSSNQPNLGVRNSDFPGDLPIEGDTFIIGTRQFRVVDPQEDGEGGTKILLHVID